jgi:uroporphyrinogen III methyltransferase / synthase
MHKGKVYIVGAGPGDPGLLTLRAVELLRAADVIFYDYLCGDGFMAYRNPEAECVYIGKRGHRHHTPQEQINRMLVEAHRAGKSVVRLKGGDPFVFGRGGEEAEFLADHGIPFEVVPGVTSAVAAPAYAGIPVTHRTCAASVAFVTGHRKTEGGPDEIQVPNADTLVYLMGVMHIRGIAEKLVAHGRGPDTPAAVVQWGTRPTQRTIIGTLATIADEVERARIHPPAVLVVGEVVRLRDKLNWYERSRDGEPPAGADSAEES